MAANSAALLRKRNAEEVEHLDTVQPMHNADLHGAITSLSPVKKGRHSTYFDGHICDGTKKLRLVGFSAEQQKKLNSFFTDRKPVQLSNCQIKESRQGQNMEVILKNSTVVSPSSKDITLDVDEDEDDAVITLSNLYTIQPFQRVTIDVKVIQTGEHMYVSGNKQKQDIVVGDTTGRGKVTLWEANIGALAEGSSYTLKNFVIREYKSKRFLSMPREGAAIVPIQNIGDILDDSDSDSELDQHFQLHNVSIIGVPQLDTYRSCLACKARVEPATPPLGRCSKPRCSMLQRFDLCIEQTSAKLVVMKTGTTTPTHDQLKTLHAFGQIVQQLAEVNDNESITREGLLMAPPLSSVTFNDKKIIIGFSRN